MTVSELDSKNKRNEYARIWYAANKERICAKERLRVKTDEQKDNHNRASQKYFQNNREKHNLLTRKYKEKYRRLNGIKPRKKRVPKQLEIKFPVVIKMRLTNEQRNENKLKSKLKKRTRAIERYRINKADPIKRELINKSYRERISLRMESDPLFKLSRNIPKLIRISIKREGYSKKSKTFSILGCTWDELKYHIESKFEPWMNWNNWGKYNGGLRHGWDIDHIIPISFGKSEFEIIRLNHFTNLQPLDSYVNRHIKRNKVA